jgi:hypothetical protein
MSHQADASVRSAASICDCTHEHSQHVYAGGCRVRADGKLCKCKGFSRIKSAPPRCVPPGSVQGVFNVGQTVAHRSGYIGEVVAVKGEHITVAFDDEQPEPVKPKANRPAKKAAQPSAVLALWPDCPIVKRALGLKKGKVRRAAVKPVRVILASALVAPVSDHDTYAAIA